MNLPRAMVRTLITTVGAAALAALAFTGGSAHGNGDTAVTTAAGEGPGYAVEDFGYPNADKILAEQHITLKRGDGHILLADCSTGTDLMEIWSRANSKICFRVTGNSGYLTLEIPSVFAVKGNAYSSEVDMAVGTEEKTFTVNKNSWTPVGESADPQGREFVLMEIRATK
ncbi:hypothetical protein [Streptomyces sp. NPDC050504]|uniref:hypothetical protein n=1 Tax=Streptomyces sp. NPDC050504 TaxID=3365618 RepID=UPI003792B8CB